MMTHLDKEKQKLIARIKRSKTERNINKLSAKIRFADFRQTTVECLATTPDLAQFQKLLETGFQRGRQPVRLLGIGVRLCEDATINQTSSNQLGLFG